MAVDIGILTVLTDCELSAVLRSLGIDPDSREAELRGGRRFWKTRLRSRRMSKDLSIVITAVGEAGNSDASAATTSLIKDYHPSLVCLVGIAAGVKSSLALGDVVLSRFVLGYEREKRMPETTRGRHQQKEPPFALRSDVDYFEGRIPTEDLSEGMAAQLAAIDPGALPPPDQITISPKVHWPIGIASGEKIFGDGSLDELAEVYHNDLLRAGEMEGIGFAIAAEREAVPWLVIRGISDHGDPRSKDGRYKDKFHHVASVAAAETTRLFLEREYSGPTPSLPQDNINVFRGAPPLHVRRVLMSIYDKKGLEPLLEYFAVQQIEVVATPNTATYLRSLDCNAVSTFEFAQCLPLKGMRGTLHPYVLGAIAADPSDPKQIEELEALVAGKIDLVFVNSRDMRVPDDASVEELLALLADVQTGGPSLLRWTIKQWRSSAAVVDSADYGALLRDLRSHGNEVTAGMRARLLSRAQWCLAEKDKETAKLLQLLWPERL